MPKWRNWQTRYVQGVVGESLWEFESPLRHHHDLASARVRAGAWRAQEGSALAEHVAAPDLDAIVLSHLRGYPDELRRFSQPDQTGALERR